MSQERTDSSATTDAWTSLLHQALADIRGLKQTIAELDRENESLRATIKKLKNELRSKKRNTES